MINFKCVFALEFNQTIIILAKTFLSLNHYKKNRKRLFEILFVPIICLEHEPHGDRKYIWTI